MTWRKAPAGHTLSAKKPRGDALDQQQHSSTALGIGLGIATALIWGSWPVFSRLSVEQNLNAHDITALRFGVAGLVLLPYLWRKGLAGLPWKAPALMVCGAGAPYIFLSVVGLKYAPAGHFGVITPSTMLVYASLAGWLFMNDKPGPKRIMGLVLIVAGVACVGWEGFTNSHEKAWIGDLIFILGGFLWATYTVSSKMYGVGSLHATALVSVFSMMLYLPIYLIFDLGNMGEASMTEILSQGFFQGILVAIIALICFTQAVAILGVSRGSVFGAMVPCMVLLFAIPVLDEWPTKIELLGLATVTAGMILALFKSKPR